MIVVAMLMFLVQGNIAYSTALALIPICLVLTKKQYRPVIIYGSLLLLSVVVSQLQSVAQVHFIVQTISGMITWLVLHLFPTLLLGYYIISSTKSNEFIAAMKVMHMSDKITIPVAVMLRFIPTIKIESHAISDAMYMREIRFGSKRFWRNPLSLLEYKIIPLIISVVKIGEELSASALTKGLGKYNDRTCIATLKFKSFDLFIAVVCIAMIVWAVIL